MKPRLLSLALRASTALAGLFRPVLLLSLAGALCCGPALASSHKKKHHSTHSEQHEQHEEKSTKQDPAMLRLTPETRIEQQCNERAMVEISREHHDLHPDETVAYAFSNPDIGKDWENADGAAVRSGEHWYHLSYKCKTSEDGMEIHSFSYTLGEEVPKEAWSAHYLVP